MSVGIKERLDFLFRGTSEAAAVGNFADNISLPPRNPDDYTSIDEDEEAKKREQAELEKMQQQSKSFKDPFSAFKKQLTKKSSGMKVTKGAKKPAGDGNDLPVEQ